MSRPRVFELRRYRLKPGTRETLVDLFEREFVETQEDVGMTVVGQYRDLDDDNCFVWLRAFADMEARAAQLRDFYGGATWRAHGSLANATMINSDNVLLLKPVGSEPFGGQMPPRRFDEAAPSGLIAVSTCALAPRTENEFAAFFESRVRPALTSAGARIDAAFVTERSKNTFPSLPVREGETVFVWVSAFFDEAAHRAHLETVDRLERWHSEIYPDLDARLWRPLEITRLAPTQRSRHRW
jgi:hypothetical protein